MARNAPGKHYREGLTLVQVMRMFPDDDTAEAWFVKTRWPNGVECPKCGSHKVQERPTRKPQPYRCRSCRKDFSVKTGTLMHSSPLGFQTWALAIFLMSTHLKGVSSMKLHRDLGVTQKTAWHLAMRIRETWKDAGDPFLGPVEADETYVGGRRRNKPKDQRRKPERTGILGKTVVAGVRDRETNRVDAAVVPDTSRLTLHAFVEDRTAPGATVYTDEHPSYRGMRGNRHEAVQHSAGEYVRGEAHTQGIESFWSMLKRAHKGTFHKISPKHLDRYVTEFTGRHNAREADTVDQMQNIVAGMVGRRLKFSDLIAD